MNVNLSLNGMHVVGSRILLGTGIGSAYFKWMTDRSRDVDPIRIVAFRALNRSWFGLGAPAFSTLMMVHWLMLAKPMW